jgi:hypothetical protein
LKTVVMGQAARKTRGWSHLATVHRLIMVRVVTTLHLLGWLAH